MQVWALFNLLESSVKISLRCDSCLLRCYEVHCCRTENKARGTYRKLLVIFISVRER